jgi:GTP-binding protein
VVTPLKRRRVGASGGDGGDVVVRATSALEHLSMNTFVFAGMDGEAGSGRGLTGRRGRDAVVQVPTGTLVKEVVRAYSWEEDDDEAEAGVGEEEEGAAKVERRAFERGGAKYHDRLTLLADLATDGQELVVARGGRGGLGNSAFRRDEEWPETHHTPGTDGELRFLELELRTLADVGLVGFPNAGKSSLLRALSRASPKVASYPFTTLRPVVGVATFADGASLRIADLPGLIEGAHADRGLGHEFLRHIERTRVLVYVVDSAGATGDGPVGPLGGDPVHDLRTLQRELKLYDRDLPRRPSLVVANKADLPAAADGLRRLRAATTMPVLEVSALTGANVRLVADSLRWLVATQDRATAAPETPARANGAL